jgi:hypothetical protein
MLFSLSNLIGFQTFLPSALMISAVTFLSLIPLMKISLLAGLG